jgi:hypothetical protein
LHLARHKASGQDVDALKEPNCSEEDEQGTNNNQRNPHNDLDVDNGIVNQPPREEGQMSGGRGAQARVMLAM